MRGWQARICWGLAGLLLCAGSVSGAPKKGAAPEEPLTGAAADLAAGYAARLQALEARIKAAVPAVAPEAKAAYVQALEAEVAATAELKAAQGAFGAINNARNLVGHAKNKWIGGADKGIAEAQAKGKAAQTDAERAAAQADLEKWQRNRAAGVAALKERQAALDAALAQEDALTARRDAAQAGLDAALAQVDAALQGLGLDAFLGQAKLDAALTEYLVLQEGTPRRLALFAAQGPAQKALIDSLLADADLRWQMAIADGPNGGLYGEAMTIYTDIRKASAKAASGPLQRLALAVALEHANASKMFDPVARYLQFERAYLANELDPAFKDLTVWDYRFVVDGNETDDTLVWGREMLRSYRPDHITMDDYKWRYVATVRTDVRYGSQYNKYDKPELQSYQNILMNGGVCGRRAFFGRFILRAFGIPTTARPQRGHAALVHWTPDGWVVNLGAGWGSGWTKTRYDRDLDFLATTQARALGEEAFASVKRAQWIGALMGETPVYGLHGNGRPGFWYGVSLYRQRAMIAAAEVQTLAAVGEELGEANESDVQYAFVSPEVPESERRIRVNAQGVITIPAAATSHPTRSTGKILFMPSNLGGMQLHYSRTGKPENFAYEVDVPKAGAYTLTARVACPSWGQVLVVTPSDQQPVEIALPLTVGLWGQTEPVTLTLAQGPTTLTFSRTGDNIRGLSIKDFTLTPVK